MIRLSLVTLIAIITVLTLILLIQLSLDIHVNVTEIAEHIVSTNFLS